MQTGTTFHRCDFQVHTPRDTNWQGKRPISEHERKQYAEEFIAACREKDLKAVAITDHHDLGFFRYLKDAAQNELDDLGNPVAEENRIIIFPGMELTLGVPCQAILILDANFPTDFLSQIPTILGVMQNDPSEDKHVSVSRLDTFKSLKQLCELFDTRDFLKGRYIILPNVGENGDFSILRKGFGPHYKEMPCVGGYVDGSLTKLGSGNQKILNGKAKEYGFKRLAVFQTSDNRKADFADLGKHATWVKWATPTAEALRQACLAQDTRVSQSPPQLPSLVIQRLEVSNSKFLGPVDIIFNAQLNCLIGGRGTGKSTILEYLRWALCDQPPAFSEEDEIPDFQKKRTGLIENTLAPVEAVITVTFLLNEIPHVIRRNAKTKHLMLKIGTGEFEESHEQNIRDLLPIQAYSQKQLSTVGVRTEELVRFVKTPIMQNLRDFQLEQDEIKQKLKSAYLNMNAKNSLRREIEREKLELTSLNQQIQHLQKELKGLGEEDKKILTQHESFLAEERIVQHYSRAIEDWRQQVESFSGDINLLDPSDTLTPEYPNFEKLRDFQKEVSTLHKTLLSLIQNLRESLKEDAVSIQAIQSFEQELLSKFHIHNQAYEAAKSRSTAQEGKLKQITDAERRARSLNETLAEKEKQLLQYAAPEEKYQIAKNAWLQIHSTRADALEARCEDLTNLSDGRIRARLRRGAGIDNVRARLTGIITGTRLRTRKIDDLCDQISTQSDAISVWDKILTELERLASLEATEDSDIEIPACPQLKQAGFSVTDLDKLARRISKEEWLELALTELEDIPIFEYKQREGDYINFAVASAGQQATTLLRVLLAQSGPPLIIDQPEEDLDNPVILEIIAEIWQAKSKRQILFSSHNANIVVNGDADLVLCCDYRTAGDQSGGQIKCRGAIDMDDIRNEITMVMEGGKEAFRLRKEKYGF